MVQALNSPVPILKNCWSVSKKTLNKWNRHCTDLPVGDSPALGGLPLLPLACALCRFGLCVIAQHLRSEQTVGFRLIAGPVLFQPLDHIGIQPHRNRPLYRPIKAATKSPSHLLFCKLRNITGVDLIVLNRGHRPNLSSTLLRCQPLHRIFFPLGLLFVPKGCETPLRPYHPVPCVQQPKSLGTPRLLSSNTAPRFQQRDQKWSRETGRQRLPGEFERNSVLASILPVFSLIPIRSAFRE